MAAAQRNEYGEAFGEWLLLQRDREGLVGHLVAAAKADRAFPKHGTPEEVRKRLREISPAAARAGY